MNPRMTTRTHHSIPPIVPPPNCFTVLVVDDMLPNRILLRKVLQSAGYAILEAENGAAAMDLLNSGVHLPDLIVTDIEMPVMDGISFISEIRQTDGKTARIPIIAASGNADDRMSRAATTAGSDVFLTKPFDLTHLRKAMAELLRARRPPLEGRSETSPAVRRTRIDFGARQVQEG